MDTSTIGKSVFDCALAPAKVTGFSSNAGAARLSPEEKKSLNMLVFPTPGTIQAK